MARGFGDLSPVADAFASAAFDPTRWNAAMDAAAKATGGFGAAMAPLDGRLPHIPMNDSMRPTIEAYIGGGWVNRDLRYRSAPILIERGAVTEFDFTSPDEMAREPYYQEFLRPRAINASVDSCSFVVRFAFVLQRNPSEASKSPKTRGVLGSDRDSEMAPQAIEIAQNGLGFGDPPTHRLQSVSIGRIP